MNNTKISPAKQKKIDLAIDLKSKLDKANAFFLVDYRGLTHKQLESLRKILKKVEAEFVVAKNRLFKIALKSWKSEVADKFEDALENPSAILFTYGDAINAVKELAGFIKNTQLPTIKLGVFEQKVASQDDFKKIATLPSRAELIALLVGRMKSPLYGLHYALNWNLQRLATVLGNIKDQKPVVTS